MALFCCKKTQTALDIATFGIGVYLGYTFFFSDLEEKETSTVPPIVDIVKDGTPVQVGLPDELPPVDTSPLPNPISPNGLIAAIKYGTTTIVDNLMYITYAGLVFIIPIIAKELISHIFIKGDFFTATWVGKGLRALYRKGKVEFADIQNDLSENSTLQERIDTLKKEIREFSNYRDAATNEEDKKIFDRTILTMKSKRDKLEKRQNKLKRIVQLKNTIAGLGAKGISFFRGTDNENLLEKEQEKSSGSETVSEKPTSEEIQDDIEIVEQLANDLNNIEIKIISVVSETSKLGEGKEADEKLKSNISKISELTKEIEEKEIIQQDKINKIKREEEEERKKIEALKDKGKEDKEEQTEPPITEPPVISGGRENISVSFKPFIKEAVVIKDSSEELTKEEIAGIELAAKQKGKGVSKFVLEKESVIKATSMDIYYKNLSIAIKQSIDTASRIPGSNEINEEIKEKILEQIKETEDELIGTTTIGDELSAEKKRKIKLCETLLTYLNKIIQTNKILRKLYDNLKDKNYRDDRTYPLRGQVARRQILYRMANTFMIYLQNNLEDTNEELQKRYKQLLINAKRFFAEVKNRSNNITFTTAILLYTPNEYDFRTPKGSQLNEDHKNTIRNVMNEILRYYNTQTFEETFLPIITQYIIINDLYNLDSTIEKVYKRDDREIGLTIPEEKVEISELGKSLLERGEAEEKKRKEEEAKKRKDNMEDW